MPVVWLSGICVGGENLGDPGSPCNTAGEADVQGCYVYVGSLPAEAGPFAGRAGYVGYHTPSDDCYQPIASRNGCFIVYNVKAISGIDPDNCWMILGAGEDWYKQGAFDDEGSSCDSAVGWYVSNQSEDCKVWAIAAHCRDETSETPEPSGASEVSASISSSSGSGSTPSGGGGSTPSGGSQVPSQPSTPSEPESSIRSRSFGSSKSSGSPAGSWSRSGSGGCPDFPYFCAGGSAPGAIRVQVQGCGTVSYNTAWDWNGDWSLSPVPGFPGIYCVDLNRHCSPYLDGTYSEQVILATLVCEESQPGDSNYNPDPTLNGLQVSLYAAFGAARTLLPDAMTPGSYCSGYGSVWTGVEGNEPWGGVRIPLGPPGTSCAIPTTTFPVTYAPGDVTIWSGTVTISGG